MTATTDRRLLERPEVAKMVKAAMADVEADIFHAIKTKTGDRDSLLAELDVLSRLGDRIHARLEYPDPLAS